MPQSLLDALNDSVTGDPENGFKITLPNGCTLVDESFETGSEDLFEGSVSAVAKCGNRPPGPCWPADVTDFPELLFTCGNDTGVSHIELVICCPDQ